jgi:hypothetical protein
MLVIFHITVRYESGGVGSNLYDDGAMHTLCASFRCRCSRRRSSSTVVRGAKAGRALPFRAALLGLFTSWESTPVAQGHYVQLCYIVKKTHLQART